MLVILIVIDGQNSSGGLPMFQSSEQMEFVC